MLFSKDLTEAQLCTFTKANQVHQLLTEQERQVVRLAMAGKTDKEIAVFLSTKPKKVNNHIEIIKRKAQRIYGHHVDFRRFVMLEMRCYYFCIES